MGTIVSKCILSILLLTTMVLPAEENNIKTKEGSNMILVVYYSRSGHTKKVAEDIAHRLGADIECIKSKKNYSGFSGLFAIIRDSKKDFVPIVESAIDPSKYDIVIIGSPCWGGTAAFPVKTYLDKYRKSFKKIACFYTSGGTPKKEVMTPVVMQSTGLQCMASVGFSSKELASSGKDLYEQKMAGFIKALK